LLVSDRGAFRFKESESSADTLVCGLAADRSRHGALRHRCGAEGREYALAQSVASQSRSFPVICSARGLSHCLAVDGKPRRDGASAGGGKVLPHGGAQLGGDAAIGGLST
jgi:hypothetical protein